MTLNQLHNKLQYAKQFEPGKVAYYHNLIKQAMNSLSIKQITKQLNTPTK